MAEVNVTIEQPETPPAPPATTTEISSDSSTAMEVGRLIEQMRQMETQMAETKATAEAAEAKAAAAETEAANANARAAEAEAKVKEPEPEPVNEPAIVPVILEEAEPVAMPAKRRGRLAMLFLGSN